MEEYAYISHESKFGKNKYLMVTEEHGFGFCRLSKYPEYNYLILSDLHVDNDCRGKGIGYGLLKFCETYTKRCNIPYMVIYINKDAENKNYLESYYKRFGFDNFNEDNEQYCLIKKVIE